MLKLFTTTTFLFCLLVANAQAELWGTTRQGGAIFAGTIFKLDNAGNNYALKYDWTNLANGKRPLCALTQLSDGKLYGVTLQDGVNAVGVLFKFDYTSNTFTKLHDFDIPTGSLPEGSLMEASNGIVYGLTGAGGSLNFGVLYEYNLGTNTYTVLKDFDFNVTGASPHGSMVEANNGKLYGLNSHGGAGGYGTIFEWDPGLSVFTTKVDLDSVNNGYHPYGNFLKASNGLLYAITYNGGTANGGVLFDYNPTTNITTKHVDFLGVSNGEFPYGNLIEATNGKLYGLTFEGGINGQGTLFEYVIGSSTLTKLVDFDASTTGSYPKGDLIQSSNGKLYGYTTLGGANNKGVVFEYDIALGTMTIKMDFAGANGQYNGNTFIEICAEPTINITYSPNDTVCSNELLTLTATGSNPTYTWNNGVTNGVPFNAAVGTDYYVVSATNICGTTTDSIQIVTNQGYNFIQEDTVCSGASYTFPDLTTISNITATTVHNSTYSTVLGCDSIITTIVYIDTVYNLVVNDTICSGSDYTFPDGLILTNIVGATNHTSSLTSSKGCDSTISTGIFIYPVYNINNVAQVCSGDDYTYPDGFVESNITAPTSHVSSFTTSSGCDSIITTSVIVNQNYSLADNDQVCSGDDYTFHDGFIEFNITTPVSHQSSLVTTKGCDSLVTTSISVNPVYTANETVYVCPGVSYVFPDGFTVANVQNDLTHVSTLVATNACDTTITTDLLVYPVYDSVSVDTICEGDSYTFNDGTVINNITFDTVHVSTYQTVDMCDSLITENVVLTTFDLNIGVSGYVLTSNDGGSQYQWVDCKDDYAPIAGETNQQYFATYNSLFAVILTKDGCTDTTDCYEVQGIGFDEESGFENLIVYPNPANSIVNIQFSIQIENVNITLMSINGQTVFEVDQSNVQHTQIDLSSFQSGVYVVKIQSGNNVVMKRVTKL